MSADTSIAAFQDYPHSPGLEALPHWRSLGQPRGMRLLLRCLGARHVLAEKHLDQAIGCPLIEATLHAFDAARIPEGPEHHVPQRQVRIVVPVDPTGVMDGVTLRPLD